MYQHLKTCRSLTRDLSTFLLVCSGTALSRPASLLCLLGFLAGFSAFAQAPANSTVVPPAWLRFEELPNDRSAAVRGIRARKFRSFHLNHGLLRRWLRDAPLEAHVVLRRSPAVVALPMPDGSLARFRIVESPVMEPELAAKFPEIKTYLGEGVDDPQASVRFDLTPAGFHAQILSPSGAVYIDPAFHGENGFHTSYYKRDYLRPQTGFRCLLEEDAGTAGRAAGTTPRLNSAAPADAARSGGNLRTYRIAVGATGEYTAYHGGTVSAGLSAIVTAINRVTGVYETELAIRLVLVANNDLVVFVSANTDPYSNSNPTSLLTQNQSTLDSVIGSANYDIGHVFSTAGGGLASLGVVCVDGVKARGETGMSAPVGDAFYIDYVAHEIGHQFGANHTFNSSTSNCGGGNRNASTAYEQGSGSTIMAYAGICGADDLQPHSDPYFHAASFEEILNYSTAGGGNGCAVLTSTGNTAPTVSAGSNYVIPQNTPFTLVATGSDLDGDALTYCWEERDLGPSTTVTAPDNGSSPLFRSWNPTASPARAFPRLSNLLNNSLPFGEVMPTTTRTMNFRVTARDNRASGGGVNTADMQVSVTSAAGPFLVTSHNSAGTFSGVQFVTWNVAGTTNAPVGAASVNILLSTDGGMTFPVTLAAGVPNTGAATVVLPNLNTTTARLKVAAAGNIFFDVGNANFTIIPAIPVPLVALDSTTLVAENCAAANGAIDPAETVTVNFALRNLGTADTTNLIVTLLATNGVTALSAPQNYGVLPAGGAAVARPFTFSAAGVCGGSFTARLQLQDGPTDYGLLDRDFGLGSQTAAIWSFTNSTSIAIPATGNKGPGSPFPSAITVAGVTGSVGKITVTLNGFSHSWPADVDALLVGPTGQTLLLLSDAGGGNVASGLTFTFDDAATAALPETTALGTGTFRPTNYGAGDTFASPAPAGTYGTTLSAFNGLDPNGTWSLYLQDDSSQDSGSIAQGWSVSFTVSNASCCTTPVLLADLAVAAAATSLTPNVGSNVTFTLMVTNQGPDAAESVTVVDELPAGWSFVTASSTQGPWTNAGQQVEFHLTNLPAGAAAILTVDALAAVPGARTNLATIAALTADPVSANNQAGTTVVVNGLPLISDVADAVADEDFAAGPFVFTIGDAETAADALLVTVASSDTNLFPLANLVLDGSDSNRTITAIPAANLSGSAIITLTVSDGPATASDSFLLTVNPVNDAPELAAVSDVTLVEGETLDVTNLASDLETPLALLTFSLAAAPTNAAINPTNGLLSWLTGEADGPGTNLISVVVTDDGAPSLSVTQSFAVIVLETNSAPELAPIADLVVIEGETVAFTNVASDADWPANGLTFSLSGGPTNAVLDPVSGEFTWTTGEADGPGTNVISIVVMDGGVPSLSATQSFTVVVLETNAPPRLDPIPDFVLLEGESLVFTNSASDPDHGLNQLSFHLEGAPAGANLDPINGVFAWTPDETQGGSTNSIAVVVVDDGEPSLSATQSFTVVVLESNAPPVLAAPTNFVLVEGDTLMFTNAFSDPDQPANGLTFTLLGAPTNAVIDVTSGVFTWATAENDGPGTNLISVVLADDGVPSLSVTQSFTVIVLETNAPPQLAPVADFTVAEGETLSFTNLASDPDWPVNRVGFALEGVVTNSFLDPMNGVFTWTPDEWQGPGTNLFSIILTDDGEPGLSVTQSFTVVVLESNQAPVLAPIADQKIHAGMTLMLTNVAGDADWPVNGLGFSLEAGAPPTAGIGPADGVFTWTPDDGDANTVRSVTVRVSDDGSPGLSAMQTFLVTVASRPVITGIQLTTNEVLLTWTSLSGRAYRLQARTNLESAAWLDLLPDVVAEGPLTSFTNLLDSAEAGYYRVKVIP